MATQITKDQAIKELSAMFDISLTSKTLSMDKLKQNASIITNLRMRKINVGCLCLANTKGFDVRAVIRLGGTIEIRTYLDDDVVKDVFCEYDKSILPAACRVGATNFHRSFVDRVEADSVEDFLNRYYKLERFADTLVDVYKTELNKTGYCSISKYDSRTGKSVSYYGK